MQRVMFSKMLGELSVAEAAERIAALELDGVDLTVRPGGHVDPDQVASALPQAVETCEAAGLTVPMITTAITDADEPTTRAIFETADACEIPYLKLGYWRYDGFDSIAAGRGAMAADLREIRELSEAYAVTPAVHTHSGAFLSAIPALYWDLLAEGSPSDLGIYADPGHLCIEGGRSAWEQQLDLVASHVAMVSIKDFVWRETADGWTTEWVGIGDGQVPWTAWADRLDRISFDGPVSLHSEYHDLDTDELLSQTAADRDALALVGIE